MTLASLFPSQAASLRNALEEDLEQIPVRDEEAGRRVGRRAAAAILAARQNDGSAKPEPRVRIEFHTSDEPGKLRQDPVSQIPVALGAYWGSVKPFVIKSGEQFRAQPPPALDSPEYTSAFEEVKRLGGDGTTTPTARTGDQSSIGIYWASQGRTSRRHFQAIRQVTRVSVVRCRSVASLLSTRRLCVHVHVR